MSPVLFSIYVGLISVIVIPVVMVIVFADYYRDASRHERLQILQRAVLTGASALAVWTQFWVKPSDDALFIAITPLWVFCGVGAVISACLGLAQWLLGIRQRKLEARLIRLVTRP